MFIQDEKTGKTSLMFLAEVDEEGKTLSHLIEYFDADVSITSYCDSNALHFACGKDNVNAVKALLENGAEVGLKNIQRKTEKDLTSDQEVFLYVFKYPIRQNTVGHNSITPSPPYPKI